MAGSDVAALRDMSERLDALLQELKGHDDPAVRDRVDEIVALLLQLHRAGLEQIMTLSSDDAVGGNALINRLADDPVVGALLLIHGVHPYPMEVRIARALDRLRPRVAAQGQRATIAAIDGRSVRIMLDGAHSVAGLNACAAPSATDPLCALIEQRLVEAAPELEAVTIERSGARATPPPAPSALIQILRHPPASIPAGHER